MTHVSLNPVNTAHECLIRVVIGDVPLVSDNSFSIPCGYEKYLSSSACLGCVEVRLPSILAMLQVVDR